MIRLKRRMAACDHEAISRDQEASWMQDWSGASGKPVSGRSVRLSDKQPGLTLRIAWIGFGKLREGQKRRRSD